MSGHSKWSQIKHQKTSSDIKRGQTFTKLANAITIAVRQGNGNPDPQSNFHLRLAMEKAKQANMPKENINRAIEHGKKEGKESGLEEVIYEGYGPGGVAIMVEAATDNRMRTTQEIKNIFDRSYGNLSARGSVTYLFKTVGLLHVKFGTENPDKVMMTAIDCGATDVEEAGNVILVYTDRDKLQTVKRSLEENGLEIELAEETMQPITTVPIINKEDAQKITSLMEKLENQEDVQKVHANFDIPKEFLEEESTNQ